MTVAEEVVTWARGLSPTQIPPQVRRRAALHLLDGLGVALAARRIGVAPLARTVAGMFGAADEASVIGESGRTSAASAAFANGVMMHSLDFDDTHTAGLVHATAVMAPTALAMGERFGRTGVDVLRALVVGYELLGRLAAAAPHGFHARGFHATSVCGTLASALVASMLSDGDEETTVRALGIAGSLASGSLEFLATGASTKQLHPGWAGLAGIVACLLARAGTSGPSTVIEGERGLYALFTDMTPNLASITAGLGTSWQTEGIAVKPYPACHLIHTTLDAAASARAGQDIAAIRRVRVLLPAESIPIVAVPEAAKLRPRTPYEAKFSVQWSVAAMLTDGAVNVDTYREQELDRADIRQLSQRVAVEATASGTAAADAPGDVTLVFSDGREVRCVCAPPAADGLEERVLTKFRRNATASSALADDIVHAVLELEYAPGLDNLAVLLRTAGQEGPVPSSRDRRHEFPPTPHEE